MGRRRGGRAARQVDFKAVAAVLGEFRSG